MFLDLSKVKLNTEYDRVTALHWLHFAFIVLGILSESFSGAAYFSGLFKIIFLVIFYYYYFKTVKKLYYTFWTFSGVIFLTLLYAMFTSDGPGAFYAYFLATTCLSIEAYILSSPIYYQLVRWWEYDFRFREDIKAWVNIKDEKVEIRLTDLRRFAGSVSMFRDIDVGTKLKITVNDQVISADVMSKRRYAIGRPLIYGVRFDSEGEADRELFVKFQKEWSEDLAKKKQMRLQREIS